MKRAQKKTRVVRLSPLAKEIVAAAARTAFVLAWADHEENEGRAKGWSGKDLDDLAPKRTPAEVKRWAEKLFATIADLNGGMSVDRMWEQASTQPITNSWEKRGTPEAFGSDLAMEALETGSTWSDDHPEHGLTIPSATVNMLGRGAFYTSVDTRFLNKG